MISIFLVMTSVLETLHYPYEAFMNCTNCDLSLNTEFETLSANF